VQHSPTGQRLLSPAEISCAGHSGCATGPQPEHRVDDPQAALDSQAHPLRQADPDHEANSGGIDISAVEVSLQRFWIRQAD